MIMRRNQTSDAQCNCTPPADWCQSPLPQPRSAALQGSSSQFIYQAWCSMMWDIPLVSSGHLSQLCFLPGSFVNLLTGRAEDKEKKIPWLRINMTAEPKTSVCYQQPSHSESKPQHWNSYWEEINSTLAEPRTMGWWYNCWIVCVSFLPISGFCKMGLWFINSVFLVSSFSNISLFQLWDHWSRSRLITIVLAKLEASGVFPSCVPTAAAYDKPC